jgi:hypothetical protein
VPGSLGPTTVPHVPKVFDRILDSGLRGFGDEFGPVEGCRDGPFRDLGAACDVRDAHRSARDALVAGGEDIRQVVTGAWLRTGSGDVARDQLRHERRKVDIAIGVLLGRTAHQFPGAELVKRTAELAAEVEKIKATAEQKAHELQTELAKVKQECAAEVAKLRTELEALAAQVAPQASADVKAAADAVVHDVEAEVEKAAAPGSSASSA